MSLDYVKNKLISQPIIMSKNISRNSENWEGEQKVTQHQK